MIDERVNDQVHRLAAAVRLGLAGQVKEVAPAYRSLLIRFDPLRIGRPALAARVARLLARLPAADPVPPGRVVEVPVHYGGADGPDLPLVGAQAGLSPAEVVALHAAPLYRVFMLGFTPGFPYLGGLPPRLATPRLLTPRPRVPAGSVGIAGPQTGVYPVESPGGWRLIGRTSLRLFDPAAARPFLLSPGDRVRFVPVDEAGGRPLEPLPAASASPVSGAPGAPGARGAGRGDGARRQSAEVEVLKPGLLTTVQDAGRAGHLASGLTAAGAMDLRSLALANLLAGNPPGAAALELTLLGGTFRFLAPGFVALAGADLSATLRGERLAPGAGAPVAPGDLLVLGAARTGARAYLAIHGGFDVPEVLGSRATDLKAALGGHQGRALRAGDRLPIGRAGGRPRAPRRLPARLHPRCGGDVTLRVLLGPQDDHFTAEGLATFLSATWRVTGRNDRMGYQLEGPLLTHLHRPDIVSDPLLPGAVQVPGSGQPIVLTADAQTSGGYAKIATVIGPDLALLAQARQGDRLTFRACDQGAAVAALRQEGRRLAAAARALRGGEGPGVKSRSEDESRR